MRPSRSDRAGSDPEELGRRVPRGTGAGGQRGRCAGLWAAIRSCTPSPWGSCAGRRVPAVPDLGQSASSGTWGLRGCGGGGEGEQEETGGGGHVPKPTRCGSNGLESGRSPEDAGMSVPERVTGVKPSEKGNEVRMRGAACSQARLSEGERGPPGVGERSLPLRPQPHYALQGVLRDCAAEPVGAASGTGAERHWCASLTSNQRRLHGGA